MAVIAESNQTSKVLRENNIAIPFLDLTHPRYKNLILDIGGVLLNPNLDVSYGTTVPPYQFKRMLRCNTWFEHQVGRLSADEAYRKLAEESNYPEEEIRKFSQKARDSLVVVHELLDFVKRLKGKLRIFCMTNSPAEDYEFLVKKFPEVFEIFEMCFYSAGAGKRKPNLDYYKHVLEVADIKASETIFIDDFLANITSAESLGIISILATENPEETVKMLLLTLRTKEERIAAARHYLLSTREVNKSLFATNERHSIPYLFDRFITAEILNDEQFLPRCDPDTIRSRNGIYEEQGINASALRSKTMGEDHGSFSIGLASLYKFSKVSLELINEVLDQIEPSITSSEEVLVPMYFESDGPTLEPVGQMNQLYLFHLAGRTKHLKPTEEFLLNLLDRRAYVQGTKYYKSPETFLLHMARLVFVFRPYYEEAAFVELLTNRVRERVGMEGDAYCLAMRVLVCNMCGISNNRDIEHLAYLQNVDGSWDAWPYHVSDDQTSCSNKALITTLAVAALESQKPSTERYKWF